MILNDTLNRYSNFDNVVVVVAAAVAVVVVAAAAAAVDDDDGDNGGDVEEDFHRDNTNAYRLCVGVNR